MACFTPLESGWLVSISMCTRCQSSIAGTSHSHMERHVQKESGGDLYSSLAFMGRHFNNIQHHFSMPQGQRAHTRTHSHACTHTRARTNTHIHTHTHTRARARARTHARTHTHTHTHTHSPFYLSSYPSMSVFQLLH